jgi:hypothetical protein
MFALQVIRPKVRGKLFATFQISGGFCLDIATEQRLSAAGAKRHPFVIRQKEFEPISRDKLLNLERADAFQPREQGALKGFAAKLVALPSQMTLSAGSIL